MKTMLVAVDFSKGSEKVLEAATRMAKALGEQVYLVHVIDDTPLYTMYGMYPEEAPAMMEYRGLAQEKAKELLSESQGKLSAAGVAVQRKILDGKPQDAILAFADEVDADLVVVGTHGHSAIGSVLMGSVSSGLVRQAQVPVLVVPCDAD
ncbi:universal stress protein [Rubritalea spongiae]|uniref:Universal stress protein n=1 Tax=Rubritalea spongiae TaxID=430797 RepID=A0ABW5E0E6_9BACT